MNLTHVILAVWGIALGFGLLLYGLDWLAGAVHRYRSRKRSLWR